MSRAQEMPLSIPREGVENLERAPSKLILPPAPASETGTVKAWAEPVQMRTWKPAPPDRNPLFLEKRVYQGSSGRVYPMPVIDRIASEPEDQEWKAIHLENEYVRFMVLPEIGGRIHVGFDKTNGYDFFYRQNVIKPALVGLAGPWISGGVEFNWPQHHRPATFMPVHCEIERHEDGSVTIWCSDHDPITRMKGMHGLCLRPGKTYLELRVRLYNRTCDTQTFLWWANVATHVHEKYQSFFPPDVHHVADHARRAITEFPLSKGTYYGVNYGERVNNGVRENEKPSHFVPDGSYPPNDLSWYSNIPVPTSYMVARSEGDFAGGYDHKEGAGVVYIANHHIAPGKKQWTWGNHEFGYAWDRSLTESDGPYIELMAGAYTDNQPDFSFLAPGESKVFSQFWYPLQEIGVPSLANLNAAVRVDRQAKDVYVHVQVTELRPNCTLRIECEGVCVGEIQCNLDPKTPLHHKIVVPDGKLEVVLEQSGRTLFRYAPNEIRPALEPKAATEPPMPEQVQTADELYLIGLHLEQYRHATRAPEIYWREAIRRDPGDSRANGILGRWHLRRGEFSLAEEHLRRAIARLTERNQNPADGEPYYNLGLTLRFLGRTDESYAAFYKATWTAAWRAPAYHRLSEIACSKHNWTEALECIQNSLRFEADNLNALCLKCLILRKLGKLNQAEQVAQAAQSLDPSDVFCRFVKTGEIPENGQERLDMVFDLARAEFIEEALSVAVPVVESNDGSTAVLLYARASLLDREGKRGESLQTWNQASVANSDYVFPSRLEEIQILEEAIWRNPEDTRAPYYLGNLLYDRKRHREAIALWERTTLLDPTFPTAWRNLGFGYYNVFHDTYRALDAFKEARMVAPRDARILFEFDQLKKRIGLGINERLDELQAYRELVELRDDLTIELVTLYNNSGQPEKAIALLEAHRFQPWEGGEGLVLEQFVRTNILLANQARCRGDFSTARLALERAYIPPDNLGEARHPLMNMSILDYWTGVVLAEVGSLERAMEFWGRAAETDVDFRQMRVHSISEMSYWSACALQQLGQMEEARSMFQTILDYASQMALQDPAIDFFATSLPTLLLFDEDLYERQQINASFLQAQAYIGLGKLEKGLELLSKILTKDPSHSGAIDLSREHRK